MKIRSLIASTVLTASLVAGGASAFAEQTPQTSNSTSSTSFESALQVSSYEWRGTKTFYGRKPPQTTTHDDGRGYIGTVTLQPGSEFLLDPANNVWTGNYIGVLYYQY
ncbi:hypothetical protein [Paenibacillus faecalis]|uniref:hypothetical protein n=1 Tax=Paenibacillus faecalis TaxID=2079532 RepID=UPI00131A5252|nr:hypothetical protein [Paenibacillus faecalis]